MNEQISDAVARIEHGFTELAALMANPEMLDFDMLHTLIPRLEAASRHKALIDIAFAYLANVHQAGRRLGYSRTNYYLTEHLDISPAEAARRLKRGEELFGPVTDNNDGWEAQHAAPGLTVSAEKRDAIAKEMRALRDDATPSIWVLLNEFLQLATHTPYGELIDQVRNRVRDINAQARRRAKEHQAAKEAAEKAAAEKTAAEESSKDPEELGQPKSDVEPTPTSRSQPEPKAEKPVKEEEPYNHALRRSYFSVSKPDENGGCRISGYVPEDIAAVLEQATNPSNTQLTNALVGTDIEPAEDMPYARKRVHLLWWQHVGVS